MQGISYKETFHERLISPRIDLVFQNIPSTRSLLALYKNKTSYLKQVDFRKP